MSLLAEPRRKQKISVDPNGKAWLSSSSQVGKRLMESMGWQEGRGLGRKEDGDKDALALKANRDGRGVGATHSSDHVWLAHQDNFSALLKSLNAAKGPAASPKPDAAAPGPIQEAAQAEARSLEARSRNSRARIHYHKFARMKDAGAYSREDMRSILGKQKRERQAKERRAQAPTEPKAEVKCEAEEEEAAPKTLTVSSVSASDYYAEALREKLARLQSTGSLAYVPHVLSAPARLAQTGQEDGPGAQGEAQGDEVTEEPPRKRKKKSKVKVEVEIEEPAEEAEDEPKKKKKKAKKAKKQRRSPSP